MKGAVQSLAVGEDLALSVDLSRCNIQCFPSEWMDNIFILSLTCITCISTPFQCSKVLLNDKRSQMYTDKMCELHINPEFVPAEICGVSSGKGTLILSLLLFTEYWQVSAKTV